MSELTRRDFLKRTGLGLAATGVAGLELRAEAKPTAASKNIEISEQVLQQMGEPTLPVVMEDNLQSTQKSQLGPFYRAGAPFRAKVTPPFEPGTVLIVSGRVSAYDTKKPLSGAVLDVCHVDHDGEYSSGNSRTKTALEIAQVSLLRKPVTTSLKLFTRLLINRAATSGARRTFISFG